MFVVRDLVGDILVIFFVFVVLFVVLFIVVSKGFGFDSFFFEIYNVEFVRKDG